MIRDQWRARAGTGELRWLPVALCLLAVVFGIWQVAVTWAYWQHGALFAGVDFRILMSATERWLDGGPFYYPYQLAGPYDISAMDRLEQSPVMYPPTMLLLLVPLTVLPAVLWWAIPVAVTGWVVWQHQPRPLVWLVLVLLLVFPTTLNSLWTGNPTIWFTMALALGTRYGWPFVLLLLKPTLAPLALLGIRRRSWWLALAVLALISLPFLPMWFDYLAVLRNTTHTLGILYSFNQLPALFIPIIAWLGRS